MSSFFHGWRRKAGCVTLVMALIVMTAWIRSLVVTDSVLIWTDTDTAYAVSTTPHQLHLTRMFMVGTKLGIIDDDIEWTVSCWWFAIPLTLLSACLLLWKPGRRVTLQKEGGSHA